MTQLRIDFQGRGEVQTFSGARVEAMGNGVQLALRVARQVRALRQVLAQQAIRILVGAALPRAVRIGKKDLDRQPLGQAFMFGHLFAPIVGQGFAQRSRHMPKLESMQNRGRQPSRSTQFVAEVRLSDDLY